MNQTRSSGNVKPSLFWMLRKLVLAPPSKTLNPTSAESADTGSSARPCAPWRGAVDSVDLDHHCSDQKQFSSTVRGPWGVELTLQRTLLGPCRPYHDGRMAMKTWGGGLFWPWKLMRHRFMKTWSLWFMVPMVHEDLRAPGLFGPYELSYDL